MRRILTSMAIMLATLISLCLVAPVASAAAPYTNKTAGSIMYRNNVVFAILKYKTQLDLYCYYDQLGTRFFYMKVLSGDVAVGVKGDIAASDVSSQTSEPRCS